jgi:hypothetical protein
MIAPRQERLKLPALQAAAAAAAVLLLTFPTRLIRPFSPPTTTKLERRQTRMLSLLLQMIFFHRTA